MKTKAPQFTPFKDRVLIRQLEAAETYGNTDFVVPQEYQKKPQQGEVMAVGGEVKEAKKGDIVIFGNYAGTKATINDNEFFILNEEDILGKVS